MKRWSTTATPKRTVVTLSAATLLTVAVFNSPLGCSTKRTEVETRAEPLLLSSEKTIGPVSSGTNGQLWENTSIAVPGNKNGCGANGALVVSHGLLGVTVADLACITSGSGSSCTSADHSITWPTISGFIDTTGDGDQQIVRVPPGADLPSGGLLLVHQGTRRNSDSSNPRGFEQIFVSTDCGSTWALRSTLDPASFAGGIYINPAEASDPTVPSGFDRVEMYVDPWNSNVYVTAGAAGTSASATVLFKSTDRGKTWTLATSWPGSSSSIVSFAGGALMTSTSSGALYVFSCLAGFMPSRQGAAGFSDAAVAFYDPATATTSPLMYVASAPDCSALDISGNLGADRIPALGISRVGSYPIGDVIRLMYPTMETVSGGTRESLRLIHYRVTHSGSRITSGVLKDETIRASQSVGSIVAATMTETDRLEMPTSNLTNTAAIYWDESQGTDQKPIGTQITNPANFGAITENADLIREVGIHQGTTTLSAATWPGYRMTGDYRRGGFYFNTTSGFSNFVARWIVAPFPEASPTTDQTHTRNLADNTAPSANVPTKIVRSPFNDYDGDGKADLVYFRPASNAEGVWHVRGSVTQTDITRTKGTRMDKLVPGDYDGDGKTDFAIFRTWDTNNTHGNWYFLLSGDSGPAPSPINFGAQTPDRPVPGDYDGDGKTDLAIFRPSEGNWYMRLSHDLSTPAPTTYGTAVDRLVPGDYNGDGKTDPAFFHPADGKWHELINGVETVRQFGEATDRPIPADYDGDGKTDLAIFRPREGNCYIWRSVDGVQQPPIACGTAMDRQQPADYDGDGKADVAYFRVSDGTWHINYSAGGADPAISWGKATDVVATYQPPYAPKYPLNDYDGDGTADPALFRPSDGKWHARSSASPPADLGSGLGVTTDKFAPGDYDGDGRTDDAVFRGSDLTWRVVRSRDGVATTTSVSGKFLSTDRPVPGDYDGDGITDMATFRSTGSSPGDWNIIRSSDGTLRTQNFGATAGDVPTPGDFDADGITDIAIFRPTVGWFFIGSSDNQSHGPTNFGSLSTDKPVQADYDGDGKTDLAIFRAGSGWFILRTSDGGMPPGVNFGTTTDRLSPADFDGDGRTDFAFFTPSTTDGRWHAQLSTGAADPNIPWGISSDVTVTVVFP